MLYRAAYLVIGIDIDGDAVPGINECDEEMDDKIPELGQGLNILCYDLTRIKYKINSHLVIKNC